MRVVVTGASGFIGGAVVQELASRGVDCIPVSRTPGPVGVVVRSYDEAPAGDVLIHLAESSHQSTIEKIGPDYVRRATQQLTALLAKPYRRVIYASSAIVYHTNQAAAQTTDQACPPSDVYPRSKFANEQLVLAANGVAARISNVYGPRMSNENVVSRVLEQLSGDGPIHVIDDNPVRDFIWVSDVAAGLVAMAMSTTSGVFNLGTGIGTSIRELASLCVGLAGPRPRELAPSHPTTNVNVRVLDIAMTREAFGWKPEVNLASGLRMLIAGGHHG